MSDPTALDNLTAAMNSAVDRFGAMNSDDFLRAVVDMAETGGVGMDVTSTVSEAMVRLAAQGSIDAAAALVVMGASAKTVIDALIALVRRIPDATEELQVREMTSIFEEWAEGEVAAGRMRMTIDENGRKLWGGT